jgi:tRNA A37 methylthiotransferase MiaB
MSYMFFYSERPGTLAQRRYEDDVPLVTKKRRLYAVGSWAKGAKDSPCRVSS